VGKNRDFGSAVYDDSGRMKLIETVVYCAAHFDTRDFCEWENTAGVV
jgi:hypothetical protein